jgi:hypothetical protein
MCNASGQALTRYILGDERDGKLTEELEERIEEFSKSFFGN